VFVVGGVPGQAYGAQSSPDYRRASD
jgi:hypothetical protein